MFNKTFFNFFLGFVAIIALAFGVLIWSGLQESPTPAENIAQPQ